MELYQVGSETEIDGNGQLEGKGSEDELLTHLLEGILKLRRAGILTGRALSIA
jgi:hypothetical protein